MTLPIFKNVVNEHIQIKMDISNQKIVRDYFISRSVAVVGVVFVLVGNELMVLTTKRSHRMCDEANKYGVPCGYLDWNETTYEAMTREVFEETSMYLPDYADKLIYNNNENPIYIQDKPDKDKRQNVSFIFISVYGLESFPLDIEKYTDSETAEVKWMSLTQFYAKYENEYAWAFEHNLTIKNAVEHFNKINS